MRQVAFRPDGRHIAAGGSGAHVWDLASKQLVFGLPGDGINGFMEGMRQYKEKIRFVQVRHEEGAAFMACSYAKFTGRLGV